MADRGPESAVGPSRPYDLRVVPPSPPSANAISMPHSPPSALNENVAAKKPKTASERRRRNLLILAGIVVIIVIVLVIWNPTVSKTVPNIDRQVEFHATSYISADQIRQLIETKFPDVSALAIGNDNSQIVTIEFASGTQLDTLYFGLKVWLNDTASSLRAVGIRAMAMRRAPIQETFCVEPGFLLTCNTQSPIQGCPHPGQYGLDCNQCASGLFGSECQVCPVCTNALRRCDDGYQGLGECTKCDEGYANPDCSECAPGYWGKQCLLCPVACGTHGRCNDGKAGTGTCVCDQGWSGPTCSTKP